MLRYGTVRYVTVTPIDDTLYDTVFQTTSGEALILRVYVPHEQSSTTVPQMTLVGVKASHKWLDSRMRIVGFPSIQSDAAWKQSRLLLGAAVHEVVKYLQLNPPAILEMTDPGLAKLQQRMSSSSSSNIGPPSLPPTVSALQRQPPDYDTLINSLTPPTPVDMPSIPSQYPDELDELSREELQQLLNNNDDDFLALIHKMPVYQEMQLQRTSIVEENAKMAISVLEREEDYKMLYGNMKDLTDSLKEKLTQFDDHKKQQDELLKLPDVSQLKHDLNIARKEALNESEAFAAAWVEDGSNITEFSKSFVEKRNKMHLRAAKMERLEQQQSRRINF
jgi:ESCRT-I complex subunit VPS37